MRRPGLFALLLLPVLASAVEPYTPRSDQEPLLVLSAARSGADPALRALRTAWRAAPDDPRRAAAYAEAALRRGQAEADERWYGQAEAALGPWWDAETLPGELRLLRAQIRQRRHQFEPALADLDRLLADDPAALRPRLGRAVLHQVQGRPDRAQADCAALVGRASLLVASSCLAQARGALGQARQMLATLQAVLETPAALDAGEEERRWARTVAAELAVRLGEHATAERLFGAALASAETAGVEDHYLLAAWADWQLDRGGAGRVVERFAGSTAEGLLLRRARAERQLDPQGAGWRKTLAALRERQAQALRRAESGHSREQAYLALHLLGQPAQALDRALDNWQTQREPLDARLLLEAAQAAARPQAAEPVRDWLRQTGLEDDRLRQLAGLAPETP